MTKSTKAKLSNQLTGHDATRDRRRTCLLADDVLTRVVGGNMHAGPGNLVYTG